MERIPHVSLEFKRLDVPAKTVFGKNVYERMLGNPLFPTPDVPIDTLLAVNTALFDAAEAAKTGDFSKIAAMNAAEKTWDTTFTTQAHCVDRVANGSATIITGAGYKTTKSETNPSQKCPAATGLKAVANLTMGGAAHIECDPIPGAVAKIFVVTSDTESLKIKNNQINWNENENVVNVIFDTHRKVDFSDLPSGTPLWVWVIGINNVGMGEISQPLGFKVL